MTTAWRPRGAAPRITPGVRNADDLPREHGLDTLRALAIVFVFMYHYMVFVSHEATFGWASTVGWVGVDLFFVLSGYLIADQLLRGTLRGRQLSLPAFYARRALRTWPVFWLVLAAYFLFPESLGGRTPPPLWRFLSFTQNLGLQPGTAFSHAWSLCIEEQFYLVLPLALLGWLRCGARPPHAWGALALLLAVGVGARTLLWNTYGLEADGRLAGYYPHVYYATLCRFDEFLPGIALALLKHLHPHAWGRVVVYPRAVLAAALAATLAVLWGVYRHYYVDDVGYGFFMSAFGYSLVAIAFGGLVLAALCPGGWLARTRIPGATPLARWSYAIYLTHKPIAFVLQGALARFELHPGVLLAAVVVASIAVGALLYRVVEQPSMRLRARQVPSNFGRAPPAPSARPAGA